MMSPTFPGKADSSLTWPKVLHGGLEAVLALAAAVVVVVLPPLRPLGLGHVEPDVEVAMRVNLFIVSLGQPQSIVTRTQAQA